MKKTQTPKKPISEEFKKVLDKIEKKELRELHGLADKYGYKLIRLEVEKKIKT